MLSGSACRQRPAGPPIESDPPPNDDCAGALPIADGTVAGDTSTADPGAFPYICGYSEESPDVWFRVSSPVSGRLFAHTHGSDFDTVLSVHCRCPEDGECTITCNDNGVGLQSAVDFAVEAGQEVYLRVSGFAGAAGPFQLTVGPGGAISGTVTDAATGAPIPSIEIYARADDGYIGRRGTTDPAGKYTIAGLETGTYRVRVNSFSDYLPEVYDDLPCPRGACDPAIGHGVEVSLGSVTPGIDFALDLGGTIAGSVAGAVAGEPIPAAWIMVYDAAGRLAGFDTTDVAGRFEVSSLAAGSYFARVESSLYRDELYDDLPCPDWDCDSTAGTPIEVALGATTEVGFVLDRLGQMTGVVTDRTTGEPLS